LANTTIQMKIDTELNFPIDMNENIIHFNDIFILEDIQRMQDLFSNATGVASIITNPDGTPLTNPSNFCSLCNLIRKTELGLSNCMKSDRLNCSGISSGMELQPCMSAGLWDTGAKLTVNGTHIANWLIGQVVNEETCIQNIIDYGQEIGADKDEFLEALNQVPVMSMDKFRNIFEMLFVIANDYCDKLYKNQQLKKQITEHKHFIDLLHKSEESLSITLHSIGDGVISTDKSGLVVDINPIAESLCGWKLKEAYGKKLSEVFNIMHAVTRLPVENPVKKVLENGKIVGLANHTVLVSKNGTEYHIADSAAPIRNANGVITGVVLVFSDVTEKYKAEERLSESERSKSVLLSNLPGVAYRCKYDRQWTKEFVSEGFFTLTGYHTDDIINNKVLSFNDLILPEYRGFLWDVWENAVQHHQAVQLEYRILTADNQIKWVWEQGIPVYNSTGDVVALEGLMIDITDRKSVEEKLRESEQYLIQSQSIAQLGTYTFDIVNNKWISSDIMDSIFGIGTDYDKSFEGWSGIIHPEWQLVMIDYFVNEVIGSKSKFDKEYKIVRKNDNQSRWVHGLGELVFDESNLPVKMIGIIQDITDNKLSTEKLRKSEQKYRTIFENVQDVFYQVDKDGIIVEISPSVRFFTEFNADELIGTPAIDLYVNSRKRDLMLTELSAKGELRDYELELQTKSGNIRHVSINSRMVMDSYGNPGHIDGSLRDITKRKMTEQALYNSEKKFHDYIEFAPHGVFVSDETGQYIEVNSAASDITGYNKAELISMKPSELISTESHDSFINHFKTVVKEGFATDEFKLLRKDKSIGYVAVDTVKLSDQLYLGFVVDITFRKEAEVELKENEEFLKKTQFIANLGNFIVDIQSGRWKSSEIMDSICGIDPDFDKSFYTISSIVHPDWIKLLKAYYLNIVFEKQPKFNTKFKIIRPNNLEERWVHAIGELKYDSEGVPVKLIATVQDITERKLSTDALRNSEELHRSILNASPNAIVVIEMDGSIRMVSPAALILYGCESADDLLGRNMFDFLIPEDRNRALMNSMTMLNGYMGTNEYRILRADNNMFFAEVNGEIIWNSENDPNGMVFIIRDITERRKAEVALKSSQVELKEFASHLQNVREEEKIQLAREIHDELGQILIAIKIDLGMMKQKVLKSIKSIDAENILTNFDNLFGLVDNTLNTTRKIMTDLRPEVLFLIGFVEAVKLYVNNFEERHHVICVFENTVTDLKLNSQQSVALYRIVQESLTNIAKHAKASKIKILLNIIDDKLVLEVIDNGAGFKTSQKNKPNSYGLLGMKERVYLLEGNLLISSQPGEGTSIKVEIPNKNQKVQKNSVL